MLKYMYLNNRKASGFMPKTDFLVAELQDLQARYESLRDTLADLPWILQGTVIEKPPPAESTAARATYMWTRKVGGKTVTVALSPQQFRTFRRAINANRRLERTLKSMRELSQIALTKSLPGSKKVQRPKKGKKHAPKTS